MPQETSPGAGLRVGLFVTCLVDLMRPSVGFAAVKLLEQAGCQVFVPEQTCCGQPAYNSGDRANAKAIARQTMAAFKDCDYIVAPSGSCTGMLAKHYPELFADEPDAAQRGASVFSAKCRELVSFLADTLKIASVARVLRGRRHLSRFMLGPARTRTSTTSRASCSPASRASASSNCPTPTCAAASAARSRPNMANSPGPSSPRNARTSSPRRPIRCWRAIMGCLMNMAGRLAREGRQGQGPPCRGSSGGHDRRSAHRRGNMTVHVTTPRFKLNVHEAL